MHPETGAEGVSEPSVPSDGLMSQKRMKTSPKNHSSNTKTEIKSAGLSGIALPSQLTLDSTVSNVLF